MRRTLSALVLASSIVLSSSAVAGLVLPINAKPFFIYRKGKNAWDKAAHNGVYCYAIEEKSVVGPFVDIYVVRDGKVVEMISQGSNGKELMERIRAFVFLS